MPNSRYTAIVDGLTAEIRDGRLAPGTRLPTHRDLAQQHGIALATATRVYAQLASAGLVVGEPGAAHLFATKVGTAGSTDAGFLRHHALPTCPSISHWPKIRPSSCVRRCGRWPQPATCIRSSPSIRRPA